MTHAWLNLLAVIITSLTSMNTASVVAETVLVEQTATVSEYAVIEQVDDDDIILETVRGSFCVPREMFSEDMQHEGVVVEFRLASDERERRLAQGQERIDRMSSQNVFDL